MAARRNRSWTLAKTIRLGRDGKRLWIDFLFEKERPPLREEGQVLGMDSNYKNGLVFSDGQVVGQALYQQIQALAKRQQHTHAEIKSLLGQALKSIDFAAFKTLCISDHADHNAAHNLEFLGLAGVYGLRLLQN